MFNIMLKISLILLLLNTIFSATQKSSDKTKKQQYNPPYECVIFSPDGMTLASTMEQHVLNIISVENGETIQKLKNRFDTSSLASFEPNGEIIACMNKHGDIEIWSIKRSALIRELDPKAWLTSIAFSPDGKLLASGSANGVIDIWNPKTGQLLRSLKGHSFGEISIAFSPDGKILASGSIDETIRLWSPTTGANLKVIYDTLDFTNGIVDYDIYKGFKSISFSPDGETLITGSKDAALKLWSVKTGKLKLKIPAHAGPITSVAFSPDGNIFASGGGDKVIRIFSVEDGTLLRIMLIEDPPRYAIGEFVFIAFSPDGKYLVSKNSSDKIRLWNPNNGKLVWEISPKKIDKVPPLTFLPSTKENKHLFNTDIQQLIESDQKKIFKTKTETENAKYVMKAHTSNIQMITFSKNSKLFASGGLDGIANIWRADNGELVCSINAHAANTQALSFNSAANILATGSGFPKGLIRLWDTESGDYLGEFDREFGEVKSLAFSPDDKYLIVDTGKILLFNSKTLDYIDTLENERKSSEPMLISPDSAILATVHGNNIILWSLRILKQRFILKDHKYLIKAVKFSLDSQKIYTISSDRINIWSSKTGSLIKSIPCSLSGSRCIVFSPDCTEFARDDWKDIKFHSTETGKLLRTEKAHWESVFSLVYSPDGKTLVAGYRDGTIRMWDIKSKQ